MFTQSKRGEKKITVLEGAVKLVFCCYSSCNWLPQRAIQYCNLSALLLFFCQIFWSVLTRFLPYTLLLTLGSFACRVDLHWEFAFSLFRCRRRHFTVTWGSLFRKAMFINCLACSTLRTLGQNGQAQITVIFAFLKNSLWFILLSLNSVLLFMLLKAFLMFFIPCEQISHRGVAVACYDNTAHAKMVFGSSLGFSHQHLKREITPFCAIEMQCKNKWVRKSERFPYRHWLSLHSCQFPLQ